MMRKRKTVVAKRITPKVMTGIPKSFGILNDPLGNQIESKLMAREESDQRKYDRFWGQDKDLQDRELERYRMAEEDTASLANEKWYETVEIHRRWDEEYQRNLWFENRSQAKYKEIERREYLKFVNSSLSSDEVINFVWGGKAGGGASVTGESSAHRGLIFSDLSAINREVALSLPAAVGALHMSVHLDGLQQAKAIVDGASTAFKQTLRRINNQTALDGDAAQPFKTSALAAAIIKKKGNKSGLQPLQNQSVGASEIQPATAATAAPVDPMESSGVFEAEPPRPVAAIEGHALYKWDQELMLQLAFMGLDKGGKGFLTAEEVSGVSFDAKTHALLSFTVFWANIKKRNWIFFQSMGSSSSAAAGGSYNNNNSTGAGTVGIALGDWMAAAQRLSVEEAVPLRHIRTQEEHLRISEGSSSHHHHHHSSSRNRPLSVPLPLSSRGAGAANVFSGLPEREHRVSRQLEEGDVVWALHHGGVLWLPAVVRTVHSQPPAQAPAPAGKLSGHSSTVTYSDYRYDLWFPISQKELVKARSAMAARQLLALPSQQRGQSSLAGQLDQQATPCLPPKPLSEERRVCAYAFDLVDSSGEGIVPLPRLVQCLQSREFSRVVGTSLALSTIFHGGSRVRSVDAAEPPSAAAEPDIYQASGGDNEENTSANQESKKDKKAHQSGQMKLAAGTADIPSLLPVFIDTFSAPSTSETATEEEEVEEEVEVEVEVEEIEVEGEKAKQGEEEGGGEEEKDNDDSVSTSSHTERGLVVGEGEDGRSEEQKNSNTSKKMKMVKRIVKVKRVKPAVSAAAPTTPAASAPAPAPAAAVDWISKLDFLEFCQAVVDVKRYSVCTQ